MAFNSSSGNDNNSRPSNFTEPPTMRAGGRKRPHIDCAVRDFPATTNNTASPRSESDYLVQRTSSRS